MVIKYPLIILFIALLVLANYSAFGHGSKPKEPPPEKPVVTQIVDNRGCAANSAMTNVPSISHHTDHKSHTSLGIGLGGCEDKTAGAIGLNHHRKDNAYKATIGKSGKVTTYGVGASIGW